MSVYRCHQAGRGGGLADGRPRSQVGSPRGRGLRSQRVIVSY